VRLNPTTPTQLRYELEMLFLRARCALSARQRGQIRNLSTRRGLLVHLGCGNALLPGWINVDCYPPPQESGIEILTVDMRRGLPFADGSVRAVFSEHFLEHLPVEIVRDVILREIRRVLEPGGVVRIGVPSGEYFIERYLQYRSGGTDALFEEHRNGATPMTMLNEIMHSYGHHYLYDFETLQRMLKQSGFTEVRRGTAGQTQVAEFRGKDRLDEWRRAMTLYVEART
jgi:predicted SAM-dependent methyltransferase